MVPPVKDEAKVYGVKSYGLELGQELKIGLSRSDFITHYDFNYSCSFL